LLPEPNPVIAPSFGLVVIITLFADASKVVTVFPKASWAAIVLVPVKTVPLICGLVKLKKN